MSVHQCFTTDLRLTPDRSLDRYSTTDLGKKNRKTGVTDCDFRFF